MTQHSGPVSPREDDQQAHETAGLVSSGHPTRAEEFRDPEPPGEDQPTGDETLEQLPGTPPGMTNDDVERRSELARFLEPGSFPCNRDELLQVATDHQAPDRVLGELRQLPEGTYQNVQEIARALGWGTEQHRT